MISLASDYTTGAHPQVLQRLVETNEVPVSGYGTDPYCESAVKKIRRACGCPDASVYFLVGGTQTNQTVISTMLRPFEGVVSADTGHVSSHEAGAIEYTGHKVLTVKGTEGKLQAADVDAYISGFYADDNHEHMVFPGMVYISFPTEYGTLYTKEELTALSHVCHKYNVPLFADGARLGYGLQSLTNDVTLEDLASLCDVFYIGGTKLGALCGEAVVFPQGNAPRQFVTQVKQHGALLAKGRLLGVQFDALFTDGLYDKIGRHAIEMAELLKEILKEKGYAFYLESPTNQQFVILENKKMQELSEQVSMSFWEALDDSHTVVRLATSWSTTKEELEELRALL